MNLKLLTLSAAAATCLMAASPMVSSSMSTDNGGAKKAIDAYSDGAGVLIINQASDTKFDNSAMNKLVFKFGDAAKASNTTLKNQVNILSTTATSSEKLDATAKLELAKVVINPPVNGTGCDDANPQTVTDAWSGGLCVGNNIEGLNCDDAVAQTINDTYHNGVCGGTNVEGLTCDDANAKTITDKYTSGICAGTNVEGLNCDDNNALTFADKYTSGVCAGVTNGTLCNDNNTLTFADKYTSGVCAGVTNGTSCNDGNAQTITDKYTSGICAGTNVEGLTCDDTIASTYADKYNNGVCVGTSANSCLTIKSIVPNAATGYHFVDLDGAGSMNQLQVYCDMTTNGGGWTRVFRHNISGGYFASSGEALNTNQTVPTANKYSILNYLDYLKRNGKYTFKISWPGYTGVNVWSQTSNPTTSASAGYTAISIGSTSNYWGGLEYGVVNGGGSFIDGSVNHSNWFYAIGSFGAWNNGIPAADAIAGASVGVAEVNLWVQ